MAIAIWEGVMTRTSTASAAPVLVGIDFSEGADEALLQAEAWARAADRPLVAVHGYPDPLAISMLFPQAAAFAAFDVKALEAKATEAVRRRVGEITRRSATEFDVLVGPGSGHRVLVDLAEGLQPALVVVGASGQGALSRAVFGTTADYVVRHAAGPVLVARRPSRRGVVLAATDLAEDGLAAVRAAIGEAERRRARLVTVHCFSFGHPELAALEPAFASWDRATIASLRDHARAAIEGQLASCGALGEGKVLDGRPAATIVQAARELGAELVVVGTHGRTGLGRLALGSVAAVVVRKAPCSVLVARQRAG